MTLNLLMVRNGQGKHVLASDLANIRTYLKLLYAYDMLYSLCLPCMKLSILLFYGRIFPTRRFTIVLYISCAFIVMWCVSALLVAIFACRPIAHFWTQSLPGRCINVKKFVMVEAGLTIFTDVALLVLPMPMVWVLKISRQQKIALSGIFLLGGL